MGCVYGPVPSRRLGRSLGIDLVPFKTCTYDCVYCQLGRTTHKTTELREYTPVSAVLAELADRLPSAPRPDYIGLAGSGEPTLHSAIGGLIAGIRRLTNIPVAVLTNGSLLWKPEVRAALAQADVIMPSLDAGNARTFARVNRPHPEISFERMVDGLLAFAAESSAKIWLEVFVLRGVNDRPAEIEQAAAIVRKMRPARVQVNTLSRPPAEPWALASSPESLERIRKRFPGDCEVVAGAPLAESAGSAAGRHAAQEILTLLARRPCTVEGLSVGLDLPPNEVVKYLGALSLSGAVRAVRHEDAVFYESVRRR
jgi:wyosine [tRNA(Phe)-imidazoG37] synthetase (radical SAM superfamily)